VARPIAGLGLVAFAAVLLELAGASLPVASVSMLVAVVTAALLGYVSGLLAALGGFFVLNYFFTNPVGSLVVARVDDLLVLAAFVAVSVIVSAVVARLNDLRVRSRRAAREVQLRLALTNELITNDDADAVLQEAAGEIVALYDLASFHIQGDEADVLVTTNRPATELIDVGAGGLTMQIGVGRALVADERDALAALGTGIATALDRARFQQELQATRLSTELARTRAGFLTAVTHDLRTPLATIKTAGAALLVEGSPLDDRERRELLESVRDQSAHLEALVAKVLEFTRARSGGLLPDKVAIAPGDLAAAAIARLEPGARERFQLDVGSRVPLVEVDAVMLEHVLVNLLENALRYAPTGSKIDCSVARSEAQVELRIADRGPGVPEMDRQRVFDEFVRLDPDTAGNMGLGLAIVRAFVLAHEGDVWCEATPGGGATFVVSLPICPNGAHG
jgi:two-component system sensor histidine kinase KdpD